MANVSNPYCEALGIEVPSLDVAKESRDANYYALLIIVLLERGEPVTLQQAAKRFEEAGVTPAGMRRVLLHAFPTKKPETLALVDVAQREVTTSIGDEIVDAKKKLADYDIIAAIDVRRLLRTLGFEPGSRRLGELGPPQKTKTLNKRGRTLEITASLLIRGSCGISRAFGDEKKMRRYLEDGKLTKLRRRLEADAKSLYALYQYGRLHGSVRLRWGFLDEHLPAPWVHRDEVTLHNLKVEAYERGVPLEVVVGSAPGWADPWSRLQRVHVEKEQEGWRSWLVGDDGNLVSEDEVQLARLSGE